MSLRNTPSFSLSPSHGNHQLRRSASSEIDSKSKSYSRNFKDLVIFFLVILLAIAGSYICYISVFVDNLSRYDGAMIYSRYDVNNDDVVVESDKRYNYDSVEAYSAGMNWILSYKSLFQLVRRNRIETLGDKYITELVNNPSRLEEFNPFDVANTINVWDLFPQQINCPDMIRVGHAGDGGKWICGLSWIGKYANIDNFGNVKAKVDKQKCIIYSFGVSIDISFEEEMLQRTHCDIFAFDPTVSKLPLPLLHSKEEWYALQRKRLILTKVALAEHSGSSEVFGLTENLYDIMHRLGHSYIDVLKIDIEGSEWDLMKSLFPMHTHSKSHKFPVGQLLIELHYGSMKETHEFFAAVEKYGFLSYSREVNLYPTLKGKSYTILSIHM